MKTFQSQYNISLFYVSHGEWYLFSRESAYKGLVRPVLEYGKSVLDPKSIFVQDEFEKFQKRAARFVIGNYTYETGSMTGILEQPA